MPFVRQVRLQIPPFIEQHNNQLYSRLGSNMVAWWRVTTTSFNLPNESSDKVKSCCIASVKMAGLHSCSPPTLPSMPHRCNNLLKLRTAAWEKGKINGGREGREVNIKVFASPPTIHPAVSFWFVLFARCWRIARTERMSSREMQGSGVGTLFYRFRHRRLKRFQPLTTKISQFIYEIFETSISIWERKIMGGGESKPKGSTNVPCSLRVSAKLPRYHTNTAAIDKHIHHLIFFYISPLPSIFIPIIYTGDGDGDGCALDYDIWCDLHRWHEVARRLLAW